LYVWQLLKIIYTLLIGIQVVAIKGNHLLLLPVFLFCILANARLTVYLISVGQKLNGCCSSCT